MTGPMEREPATVADRPSPTTPSRPPSATAVDAVVLLLIALVVNFTRIGTTSVWLDESTSILYARGRFVDLLDVLTGADPNMGLYYVLLSGWVRLFGESETAVRSLSAIFSALSVSAMYLLGARLFGRTAGVVAGLLLAINTFMVAYAQMARAYALLVLLVIAASYFFVAEIDQPSRRNRVGYVVSGALAFYAHYFAALVLIAHALTLVVMRRRNAFTREWLGVAASMILLCLPEVYFAYRGGAGALINWIPRPAFDDIGEVLTELAGGSEVLLVALIGLGGYGTLRAVRSRSWWRHGFVATWLLAPLALSYAIAHVKPIFIAQYLIICAPPLVLFGASGIASVSSRALSGAAAAVLMLVSGRELVDFYGRYRYENWRDAANYVVASARPGDGIIFFPDYAQKPYEYYVRRLGVAGPANVQRNVGSAPGVGDRVWLMIREANVITDQSELAELRSSMRRLHRLATREVFYRVSVELYTR